MKRSSIFSSETLLQWPRPTKAFVLALALCLGVRLALLARPDAFLAVPETELQQLYTLNELRYRAGDRPDPRVIVMGTSRLGILPTARLAEQLGYVSDDIVNYALAGNTFWRTLVFFRRNPAILRRADLVLLDLLPFQLYEGVVNPENDLLLLRMGTLKERLRVRRWPNRVLALADFVFPAWSERHTVAGWRRGWALMKTEPAQRYDLFVEAASAANRYRQAIETGEPVLDDVDRAVHAYAPATAVSRIEARAIEDLVALLPDGCTLVLAWLPVRPDLAARLAELPVEKCSYRPFKAFMEKTARPGVVVLWADNDSAPEFTEADFIDVVHYQESGFNKLCDLLARSIREKVFVP